MAEMLFIVPPEQINFVTFAALQDMDRGAKISNFIGI